MKKLIKDITRRFLYVLPTQFSRQLLPLFSRIIGADEAQKIALTRFVSKLMLNYDKIARRLVKRGKVMYINKMQWSGSYFNIAILNNLLSLVIYSLYLGYVPIIQINEDAECNFSWWWFFKQPLEQYTKDLKIRASKTMKKVQVSYSPGWLFSQTGEWHDQWHFIYHTFVKLNDTTQKYVDSENTALGDLDNVLGVLVRGTDYTSTKPKGHPIQPELNDVLMKAREVLENNQYRAIYVATEDETYFNAFALEFGTEKVLSNERVYYDKKYIPGTLIGSIHFDRENDNYQKSLEYLSSMILLSRCSSLVAGNCGGTCFALLYAREPFRICNIFNKGLY